MGISMGLPVVEYMVKVLGENLFIFFFYDKQIEMDFGLDF